MLRHNFVRLLVGMMIQDTNHSDAHGRVNLKTACRGKGAHNMEAMDMLTKEIKKEKMTGESCREEGNVIAKGNARKEEKTDIRNWFKKEAEVKANIHHIKAKVVLRINIPMY